MTPIYNLERVDAFFEEEVVAEAHRVAVLNWLLGLREYADFGLTHPDAESFVRRGIEGFAATVPGTPVRIGWRYRGTGAISILTIERT